MTCRAPDSLGKHRVPAVGACPCGDVRRLAATVAAARPYVIDNAGMRTHLAVDR